MPSTIAATKRSWICSVTIRREDAVQRCPVWKKAPLIAQFTATARSASSSTTSGFLLPISSWNLARRAAHFCAMCRPVSTEPVKLTAATSGEFEDRLADHRAAPHDQVEHALRARRACCRMSAIAQAEAGTRSAGLSTTRVAVGERRRDLPGGDREREVPGRDQPDHAERLAVDVDLDARAGPRAPARRQDAAPRRRRT